MLFYLHNKQKNQKTLQKMSITDLEKELKIKTPTQSESDLGHHVSTKFIGAEQSHDTINVLKKYDTHVLEYLKFCMNKYHHELFLKITERRANYIKSYRLEQTNKLKKTHHPNNLHQRKLNALYESGQDYDESYFHNDDQNDNMSELDYNLNRDADNTANLTEGLRVISRGIDEITKLIEEKQDIEKKKRNQNIFNIFTLIVTLYIAFNLIFAMF